MSFFRLIRSVWLTRGARADFNRSERHRRIADAYLDRSIARLDVADTILEAERTALMHRI